MRIRFINANGGGWAGNMEVPEGVVTFRDLMEAYIKDPVNKLDDKSTSSFRYHLNRVRIDDLDTVIKDGDMFVATNRKIDGSSDSEWVWSEFNSPLTPDVIVTLSGTLVDISGGSIVIETAAGGQYKVSKCCDVDQCCEAPETARETRNSIDVELQLEFGGRFMDVTVFEGSTIGDYFQDVRGEDANPEDFEILINSEHADMDDVIEPEDKISFLRV